MKGKEIIERLRSILRPMFTTRAAGIYILLFAVSIAVATFIENDYGTSAAQKLVYKARWFELLLLLFSITIVVNIVRFRMVQQKKWAVLTFHLAMIVILIGAGITRYFGNEGMMHIREGESSNRFLSADTWLKFEAFRDGTRFEFNEPVLFASLGPNRFHESYRLGDDLIEVRLKEFIPNPVRSLEKDENGTAILKIVFGGSNGRSEYYLARGEVKTFGNVLFNFSEKEVPGSVRILYRNDTLLIEPEQVMVRQVMATREIDTLHPADGPSPLRLRALYTDGSHRFVFGDFNPKARIKLQSGGSKMQNGSEAALRLEVRINDEVHDILVYGSRGLPGTAAVIHSGDLNLAVSYGSKYFELPFRIKLYDFILERYPGTNSAASYASEVQLIDPRRNYSKDYRIYMNHILNYDGYRFFQSSYDRDEKGTYLSVNHDYWGTFFSYLGYILLTLGLILTLFSRKSRFYQLSQMIKRLKSAAPVLLLSIALLGNGLDASAQKVVESKLDVVSKDHAGLFSRMIVQDFKGRLKPMHTLTRELMRKVYRKEKFRGLTADQVVLSMFASPQSWYEVPLIKVGANNGIRELLGITGDYAAYGDFFDEQGHYKLDEEVSRAFNMQPVNRGTHEKQLIKVDERVNIVNMIFSGRIFRIVPLIDDPNHTWVGARSHGNESESELATRFFSAYQSALHDAMHSGDYRLPDQLLEELKKYQYKHDAGLIPPESKLQAEILLNNLHVFDRLALFYGLLGMTFLILLFVTVFKPTLNVRVISRILIVLVLIGFLFHTTGLGLRWYISGRAPWSNGYESMIYIAWTTTLAGLIFTRKSPGGMAATMVLASTILLIAMLSYLDPQITPLVPVLRSYWLTIHVSLEAGSYGFLMLGAILGLINLILMIFLTERNKEHLKRIIREMSYLSEMTITGGLIMLSIGTYLGGVWANESWGRYWGWDAKETWALVTILVYAFILHMRLIPKMKGFYTYNLATIFGLSSVIMTYYGVNYYLSGLHSYAAGDPVPIPSWVYISVASITAICILAYWRKKKVIGRF